VFVVGCLGGWESAAKVLFESESLRGDIKKGKSKGKDIASYPPDCVGTLLARDYKGLGSFDHDKMIVEPIPIHAQATQYKGGGANRNNDGKGNGLGIGKPGDPMNTLDTSSRHAVAYENHGTDSRIKEIAISPTVTARWGTGGNNVPLAIGSSEISGTLRANPGSGWRSNGTPVEAVAIQNMAVRRLTEVECERLQGFPDNYTNIKENCPSGVRYKALGNSMAVPVMRWIGERINGYEQRGMES
jgi:DNA (cytosine-5)-methyltransferase 1